MLSAWKKILGFFWMICTLQIIVYGYRKQGKKNTLFRIHGKRCSIAFIWRSKKISNSRQVVYLLGCIKSGALPYCLFHCSQKKLASLTQSIEQVFLSFFFLFVYLVMPSTASILYFRQEINKEVQNTRRDFNKNPVTGGLLQPIMPFTAVYIQFVFLWFLGIN